MTIAHRTGQPNLGLSLWLLLGQLCHLIPYLPQLAPAMHGLKLVLLFYLWWRSPVFPGNTESQSSWVSSLETRMVTGIGCSQMPLDLQGHSGHLVGQGCGPLSGYWFQVSVCLVTQSGCHWHENSGHELKLQMSSYNWVQRPMQENKDTNGLVITASFPWWFGDPFICHQWIPLQMWGHFLPGKMYSPAFSNHQSGNLRDGHELPQLHNVKPDPWDPVTSFWAHPGMPENVTILGTLDGLVGSPKSQFIPCPPISTKRLWSLLLWYRVWVDPVWLATWLLASN